MRIEALKSFVTLVRAGSYAATADELFMSSTTIHGQIRALEQELGTTLLTFRGRDLHLTGAGSRLLLFAEQTLEARKKLDDDISGVRRRSPAKLRIAALHGPSIHVLPTAIRAYHQLKNDIVVAVTTSNIGSGLASLSSGQADVAILNDLHTDEIPGGFAVTTVYEDTLAMIIRTEDYEPPDINLLSKYPVATQSPTSAYRKYLEQWARTVGVPIEGAFDALVVRWRPLVRAPGQVHRDGGWIHRPGPRAFRTDPGIEPARLLYEAEGYCGSCDSARPAGGRLPPVPARVLPSVFRQSAGRPTKAGRFEIFVGRLPQTHLARLARSLVEQGRRVADKVATRGRDP